MESFCLSSIFSKKILFPVVNLMQFCTASSIDNLQTGRVSFGTIQRRMRTLIPFKL